ncbi:MAG: hypothetical protein AB7V26_07980 [Lysobacterales bacterium]
MRVHHGALSLLGIGLLAAAAASAATLLGLNHHAQLSEISGAARSLNDPSRLWVVNDSFGTAELHALHEDGEWLGAVGVAGVENQDWEDLTAFRENGQAYLLIADTGDNGGLRDTLSLWVVPEPESTDSAPVEPAWRIDFRLPEGPRDIEAVAVDAPNHQVYLIAKRHFPRVLYCLPLHPQDSGIPLVATRIGSFATLPAASAREIHDDPQYGRFRGDVTALALDPAGRYALVLSYRDLYFYARRPGQSWLAALHTRPTRLGMPPMPQAEALALDPASRSAVILSERLGAPIYRLRLP